MKEYKAWIQESVSPFTNLKFASMDYPQLGDRELIIETKAATLNFQLDQVKASFLVFTNLLAETTSDTASEVLKENKPKKEEN